MFLIIAFITAFAIYFAHAGAHAAYSSVSATVGFPSPRDILHYIAIFYLGIFITGIVFLAFEIRERDVRSNMLGILDSRPYSNLELVFGRFIGLFLCAFIPIIVLLMLIQSVGWLLPLIGSPVGGIMAPYSLLSFAIYMVIPSIAFCCALVMFLTILVRQRMVAMVLALAILAGLYYLTGTQPYNIALTFDLFGTSQVKQVSIWLDDIADGHWWLQRLGILLISFGLLFLTALLHPRLDTGRRLKKVAFAMVLPVAGTVSVFTAYHLQQQSVDKVAMWHNAHTAHLSVPVVDIIQMNSAVAITPGEQLDVKLTLDIKAQPATSLEKILLSLNPGFSIAKITDKKGQDLHFAFSQGLLIVTPDRPLLPNETFTLNIAYHGNPDPQFGYLDSALSIHSMPLTVDRLAILDLDNAIFDNHFVALMPGIHWLPSAGVDLNYENGKVRHKDFYQLSMTVQVPEGWTVAGPGLREQQGVSDGVSKYSFKPASVVPEVALIAAQFQTYASEINGVHFEVLIHPDHAATVQPLMPGSETIKQWIGEQLSLIEDAGLKYPYKAFSLVEVPNTLRSYRGGWQMDSAMAPPSMVMMKEKGFPTARFDASLASGLKSLIAGNSNNQDSVEPGVLIRDKLIQYFANDFSGGSVFSGLADSLFTHQTAAAGREAIALDYTLRELTTLLVSGDRSYFSIKNAVLLDESLDEILDSSHQPEKSVANKVIDSFTSQSAVWQVAKSSNMANFDPWQEPTLSVDVLALKYGKLAQAIYDQLGPRQSGQLLAQLIAAKRGTTFDKSDLLTQSSKVNAAVGNMIDEWLSAEGVSGFYTEQVQLFQLPDTSAGTPQYQLRFRLQNGEPTTGFARISWTTRSDKNRAYSDLIRVPAESGIDFGLVLTELPESLYVEPYLSLNREEFLVEKFGTNNIVRKAEQPFDGVQQISAAKIEDPRIIVDDLDQAFALKLADDSSAVNTAGKPAAPAIDNNFFSAEELPRQWNRLSVAGSWGKYRRTAALKRAGDGSSSAIFTAEIPQPGDWRLEVHVPDFSGIGSLGEWELTIVDGTNRIPVLYNAANSHQGWNTVGEYRLTSASARLEISDKTNGTIIIADAIAWTPSKPSSQVALSD